MEFFHGVNVNWMGKTKYFVALSLILLAVGGLSVLRRGMTYGIDFRGGTDITVRFAQTPPIAQIRSALSEVGLTNSSIQAITDPSDPKSKNDLVISLEQKNNDASLDTDRQTVVNVLYKVLGGSDSQGKQDFNAVVPAALADYLTQKDPLALGLKAGDTYKNMANALTSARDSQFGGLVQNFSQLNGVQGATSAVLNTLGAQYSLGPFSIRDAETVGPTVGKQLRTQAILATLYALGGMLIYIAFRFEWVYGAAAVIAVFHDVLITLGFFSLFRYEISLTVIAALLTLVGYSMNDTIVIFDRVRENLRLMRGKPFEEVVNTSINQTLSRTILTSGLTFLTVAVLYVLGGQVLRAFSFAMVVGVVVGTYSSFGIAAPIVVAWNKFHGGGAAMRAGSAGTAERPQPGTAKRVPAVARR